MIRKLFLFSLLLAAPCVAAAFAEYFTLAPKISLGGAYAGAGPREPGRNGIYKSAMAMLELPLNIKFNDNIYADINYFVRADYNTKMNDDKTVYTYNFQKANINYEKDSLLLKIGRLDYQTENKNFVIYYGPYPGYDNLLPTALDGARHTAEFGIISWDLLAAREVKKLSFYDDSSLVYGGALKAGKGKTFSAEVFYYARGSETDKYKTDAAVYGAGAALKARDLVDISLYAAMNDGTFTYKNFIDIERPLKGYAFNAALGMPTENKFGSAYYRFNVYYGSGAKNNSMPFTPINQNTDRGYVFGGSNLLAGNISGANTMWADTMIMSFTFNLRLKALKAVTLRGGLYNFISNDDALADKDIGNEANFGISYKKDPFEIMLDYGFFTPGNAAWETMGIPKQNDGAVNKIGLRVSYDFAL